jgi:hypothetical protein
VLLNCYFLLLLSSSQLIYFDRIIVAPQFYCIVTFNLKKKYKKQQKSVNMVKSICYR